jgi:hypothetical protein
VVRQYSIRARRGLDFEDAGRVRADFRLREGMFGGLNRQEDTAKPVAKGRRAHLSRSSFSTLTKNLRCCCSGGQVVAMMSCYEEKNKRLCANSGHAPPNSVGLPPNEDQWPSLRALSRRRPRGSTLRVRAACWPCSRAARRPTITRTQT